MPNCTCHWNKSNPTLLKNPDCPLHGPSKPPKALQKIADEALVGALAESAKKLMQETNGFQVLEDKTAPYGQITFTTGDTKQSFIITGLNNSCNGIFYFPPYPSSFGGMWTDCLKPCTFCVASTSHSIDEYPVCLDCCQQLYGGVS